MSEAKPKYEIKPLTKTDHIKRLVSEVIDGVGNQEFTATHIIRFVSEEIEKSEDINSVSNTLLYRVIGQELERLYDDQVLERYEGGPPWVYVRAEEVK